MNHIGSEMNQRCDTSTGGKTAQDFPVRDNPNATTVLISCTVFGLGDENLNLETGEMCPVLCNHLLDESMMNCKLVG